MHQKIKHITQNVKPKQTYDMQSYDTSLAAMRLLRFL